MNLFNKEKIWLVLGAGISRDPPSSVPLWSEMKNATIRSILDVLNKINSENWHNPPREFDFDQTSVDLQRAILMPEVVIECLCDVYLEPNIKTQLQAAIAPIDGAGQLNVSHTLIAQLISTGKVKGVITTNFDRFLEEGLEEKRIPYHVVLPPHLPATEVALPIFKVHGSIDKPGSLVFLRPNYAKGLPRPVADSLLAMLRNSLIIVCGYSGNDLDFFPLLRRAIIDPHAGNTTLVVDPAELTPDSPYSELAPYLTRIAKTATSFFAELQNVVVPETPPQSSQVNASLVPFKEPFECALFVANALLSSKNYSRALRYFDLAEDVATDTENRCGKGIATLGRSLCLFGIRQNQWAFSELERGRAILGPIDIESDVDSTLGAVAEGRRISIWLLRAQHALALTAIAISLRSSDTGVKGEMARIASSNCFELSVGEIGWHSEQTEPHLVSRTVVMNKLTTAYETFVSSGPGYLQLFEECLDLCKSGGHTTELLATLYILTTIQPNKTAEYRGMLDESEQLVTKEIKNDLLSLFERPGEPFGAKTIHYGE